MAASGERAGQQWPYTGQQEALARSRAALDLGQAVVVILGAPGVGKSRLADELASGIGNNGGAVVRVTANTGLQHAPLAAIAHLLPPMSSSDPVAIFQAASSAFLVEGNPTTVFVDDAQWLDVASAAVLAPLAESGVLQLVLSARLGESLSDVFSNLRATERCSTFEITALDPGAVDSLLHRALGGTLDGAAIRQFVEVCEGNPLLLREVVAAALDDGTLKEVGGVWRLSESIARNHALGDRVLDRLATLGDDARRVIEIVAVGGGVGLDDLELQVGLGVLDDLEQQGLIRVDSQGRRNEVMLTQPMYGEVVRASVGRVRLRGIARDHVQRVTSHGSRRRDDEIRVAQWQLDAGMSPDPQISLNAAYVARHALDFSTTATMARAALDAGENRAAVLLAQSLYELGHFDDLDAVVLNALRRQPDESEFTQLTRMRAIGLLWGSGDFELAIATLAAAEAVVVNSRNRELLQFARSLALAWSGRVIEANEIAERLLGSQHEAVVVQGALTLELIAAMAGPTARAVALADQYFPIHLAMAQQDEATPPGNHLVCKSLALANAGDIEAAFALADFGYGASIATRSQIGQMWFSLQLAQIALLRGDATGALRWLREHVALCRVNGHRRPALVGLSQIAIASAYLGDIEAAEQAVGEMNREPELFLALLGGEAFRANAWVLAARGDLSGARAILNEGAEQAEAAGVALMGALLRFDALRLGDRRQGEALIAAARECGSVLIEYAARWATNLNDGAALESVSEAFSAIGCDLFAAEASGAAGVAWRTAGSSRQAAHAERRADQLARKLHGLSPPTLVTVDTVVPLTARELELALLVSQGLASKDIAQQLVLSARTVSNHLQNAYAKLGVSRRSELVEALGRYGSQL